MALDQLVWILFPLLFLLVLVWFASIHLLCRLLERRHPAKYEAMGRPAFLRMTKDPGPFTHFLRFVFLREHRRLGDRGLSRFADGMLVLVVVYFLLFGGLFGAMITGAVRV
ncbi:MAG: hypothetical protein KF858_12535 [Candidatus Sumerlaeia bacterium]|nr:hypothetical protein [Candidatus Sumerlaeia bacterium]